MKTNYGKKTFFVLTNSEEKLMAVIQCKKGLNDISEKVKQAISEDEDLESINLLDEFTMDSRGKSYIFRTENVDEFGDEESNYYSLTNLAFY